MEGEKQKKSFMIRETVEVVFSDSFCYDLNHKKICYHLWFLESGSGMVFESLQIPHKRNMLMAKFEKCS